MRRFPEITGDLMNPYLEVAQAMAGVSLNDLVRRHETTYTLAVTEEELATRKANAISAAEEKRKKRAEKRIKNRGGA